MKNLMKKIRKSNKGFTLVELIIVIAIIAVLAAVAAPQYIKYVERSRNSTLEAAASSAIDICKAEAALGNIELTAANTPAKITFADGSITVTGVSYPTGSDLDATKFEALLGTPVANGATVDYTVVLTGDGTAKTITNAAKDSTNWG